MGIVALRNTNHWMRGGTYGWQAADAGCISILFTYTQPNMPPWGGMDSCLGNNPLVVSIPREQGHIVLDMAISQFAFGKISDYKLRGEKLSYAGGWDDNNELSNDPEKILLKEYETGVSQVYLCICPEIFNNKALETDIRIYA